MNQPPSGTAGPDALWEPLVLAKRELRNRVVVAPMSRVSTSGDGVPTEQMSRYYQQFAWGGFGLIVTEGIYPAGPASQGYANQPGLVTASQVVGWRLVTDAVHDAGGLIVAQLMHAGALSQHLTATVAPSAIPPQGQKMAEYGGTGSYPTPVGLTPNDIEHIVAGFAASARRAKQAGFDGVEVHAANGYLLDQFLTPYTNIRSGRYGGSPTARAQLTADVVKAICDAEAGSSSGRMIVGVRLSQAKVNNSHHKWRDEQEAAAIFRTVAAAGPDYLHLAGEGRPWTDSGRAADGTALGALARQVTGLPVVVNGGLDDPALIQQVFGAGEADLVSIGRGALADPDWPQHVRTGGTPRRFHPAMISPSASVQNTQDYLDHLDHLDHLTVTAGAP